MKLLFILQFFVALFMIIAVLLHSAKADGMGGIGGSSHVFSGAQNELEKGLDRVTASLAISFIVLSLLLAIFS